MSKKGRELKCKCPGCSKRKKRKSKKRVIYKVHCKVKCLKIICPIHSLFSVKPIVKRYFFVAPHDINLTGEKLVLFPSQFVDDEGETVAKFMDFGHGGYFNLYINGVLQEGKLYHVNSDTLTIVATGQNIYKGTPVILESIGFIITRKK